MTHFPISAYNVIYNLLDISVRCQRKKLHTLIKILKSWSKDFRFFTKYGEMYHFLKIGKGPNLEISKLKSTMIIDSRFQENHKIDQHETVG